MSALAIPFLRDIDRHTSMQTMEPLLEAAPKQPLAFAPWPAYPYHPQVSFSIGYGTDAIFLQYHVQEKALRAVNSTPNSSVWEDSCVEFFIAFDNDAAYYNLEFNCIGAALIGYGEGRTDRKLLPDEVVRQIRYKATIANETSQKRISWQLTLDIPLTVFYHHQLTSLRGKKARANFYKCGDLLPDPHFVTWSNIEWPEPDFHLSNFFAPVTFSD